VCLPIAFTTTTTAGKPGQEILSDFA